MKIIQIEVNGIVRSIDNLGRIVIPMEMRKELKLVEGAKLEIFWSKKG